MKKITLLLCSLLIAVGTIGAQSDKNKKEAEVTYSVNIHCDNCKKKIANSLPHEKGVKDLKVSVEEKTVWVKFDTAKTDKEKLRKAIEKLGFEATEKTDDTTAALSNKACGKSAEGCSKKCEDHSSQTN